MRKGFASNARLVLLSLGVSACFVGLGARLVCLHWLERESYTAFLEQARKQTIVELARRGDILDVRGNRLATSRSRGTIPWKISTTCWTAFPNPAPANAWPRCASASPATWACGRNSPR